jgi:Flp pilus assembly protein TadD
MSHQRLQLVPHAAPDADPVHEVLSMTEIPTLAAPSGFNPLAAVEEGLAASAMAVGDHRAAIRHCSQLVQLQPEHYEAWLNLGVARLHVGESEDAVFCFHQASRLRPGEALPWVNLGIVRQRLGEADAAAEAYRTALELDPRQRVALWNLALLLDASGA